MGVVGADTHQTLSGVATGDVGLLDEVLGLREAQLQSTGLDARTFALVKIAALIALDAPPASYAWQIGNALQDGATAEDILAVLRAFAGWCGVRGSSRITLTRRKTRREKVSKGL
jgi:alkylhydroperoxidase/carboxymuconolactone decarboxylase family protein YurZ